MSFEIQSHVGCLIARIVLGKGGKEYQRLQERYLKDNGPEWTCKRSKAIWNAANHLRNNDPNKAIKVYQENSISYDKGTLIPKGPEGVPVKRFLKAQRPAVIKRYAAVLRFYTGLQLNRLSPSQRDKAFSAITQFKNMDNYIFCHKLENQNGVKWMFRYTDWKNQPSYPGVESRITQYIQNNPLTVRGYKKLYVHADSLRGTSMYYSEAKLPKELRGIPYASMALSLITNNTVPPELEEVTPCHEMREFLKSSQNEYRSSTYDGKLQPIDAIGKISVIQERGCKARVVATPSAWIQLSMAPFHKMIVDLIEDNFPENSCITKQDLGAYAAVSRIAQGKSVYSVDLSSATDNFPRRVSFQILHQVQYFMQQKLIGKGILQPEDIDTDADPTTWIDKYISSMDWCCNRPWKASALNGGSDLYVQYGKGQPMGIYSSFPLFHLSNILIAKSCEYYVENNTNHPLSKFDNGTTFFVLGDDIIFSDRVVASEYRKEMAEMEVSVSPLKTFEGKVAEFGGFMIYKTNQWATGFRPYKHPVGDSISNGISFLANIGVAVKKLSPWWERNLSRYQQTQNQRLIDLSPMLNLDSNNVFINSNRGDNETLKNLCNALLLHNSKLPDLSGSTRINKLPLFHERGMFEFYGFDPVALREAESREKSRMRSNSYRSGISQDPLLKEVSYTNRVKAQAKKSVANRPPSNRDDEERAQALLAAIDNCHSSSDISKMLYDFYGYVDPIENPNSNNEAINDVDNSLSDILNDIGGSAPPDKDLELDV